jgi:cytochrome c oxidase subunit II
VILVAFLVYSVSVGRTLYARPYMKRGALTIQVNAKQWWWEIQYRKDDQIIAKTANEIHIPTGQPVVFQLVAGDVIHSFWVPSLTGKMDLIPGRTNELWLQAEHAGIYRGQCAEYCGEQHAHMAFEVVAEPEDQFKGWLQWQQTPAVEPTGELALRGRQVFLTGPCALCHTIGGTNAFGQTAPDLTHVASRRYIAAGTLPNNRGSLGGWIANSQGVKPGNHMPRITLPAADLDALLAYMESMK